MNEQEKYRYFQQFNRTMYVIGRVTLIVSLILLVSIPFLVGIVYDAMPDGPGFLSGFVKVAIIYYPVAIVEFFGLYPHAGRGRQLPGVSHGKCDQYEDSLCHECQRHRWNQRRNPGARGGDHLKRGHVSPGDHGGTVTASSAAYSAPRRTSSASLPPRKLLPPVSSQTRFQQVRLALAVVAADDGQLRAGDQGSRRDVAVIFQSQ